MSFTLKEKTQPGWKDIETVLALDPLEQWFQPVGHDPLEGTKNPFTGVTSNRQKAQIFIL